jgi:hypothetical protein
VDAVVGGGVESGQAGGSSASDGQRRAEAMRQEELAVAAKFFLNRNLSFCSVRGGERRESEVTVRYKFF